MDIIELDSQDTSLVNNNNSFIFIILQKNRCSKSTWQGNRIVIVGSTTNHLILCHP